MSELNNDDEVMIVSAYECPQDQLMFVDAPEIELQLKPEETAMIPFVTDENEDGQKLENLVNTCETNDSSDLITEIRSENDDSHDTSDLLDHSEGKSQVNDKVKRTRKIDESNKQFSCDICNKRFTQKTSLYTHRKNHNETYAQYLKCEICSKIFASKASKNTHMKAHAGFLYQCPRCGTTNKWRNNLLRHIKKYHKGDNIGVPIEKRQK